MSSPSPPILTNQTIRPKASDSSLEFWWGYPSSISGSAVTNYTISCTDPPYSQTIGPSTFYNKLSNLTNGTEYSFQVTATNSNGESDPASFRTVAPGVRPSGVQNVSTTVLSTGVVQVMWDAPASDGGAPIGWYVVKPISSSNTDPKENTSAYTTDRTALISTLDTASVYRFNVHAVNDPGYSPAVSTSTVAPIFGDRYSYIEVFEPNGAQNYAYRAYNTGMGWSTIDTGYTITDVDGQYSSSNYEWDYDYGGTANTFYDGFYSRYTNSNTGNYEYKFDFRTVTGSLLRTIVLQDNNSGYDTPYSYGDFNTAFFYNSNDATEAYDLQLYQPNLNIYQSTSITINGGVDTTDNFTNGAYFVMYNSDTNYQDHYIWNIYSNAPTLVTTTWNYYREQFYGDPKGNFLVTMVSNTSYYDSVTYISETGFVSTSAFPNSNYTNIYTNSYYGTKGDRIYIRAYNQNTSMYDVYIYNNLPSMTPIVLSNLEGSGYNLNIDYNNNYGEDYNQTDDSDIIVITNLTGGNNLQTGTAYAIFGSNATVVSTTFTNTNYVATYLTEMNSNSICFIEQENTQVSAHFLRRTGEVSTILSSVNAFYNDYQNNYTSYRNFSNLFFYNLPGSNYPDAFSYIFSNGQIIGSTLSQVYPGYSFAGRNGLIVYNASPSNIDVIQNGRYVSTIVMQSNINNTDNEYPDLATGNLFAYSYNAGNTEILMVTNSTISTMNTAFFTTRPDYYFSQSFAMMYQSEPFQLLAVDTAGNQTGYSTIGFTYENNYYTQSNSICFISSNDDNGLYSRVVFNYALSTFTVQEDTSGDSQRSFYSTDPTAD